MVPFGRLSYGGGAQPRATMFGRDEIAVDLFDAGIGVAVRVVHRDEQVRRRAGTIPDALQWQRVSLAALGVRRRAGTIPDAHFEPPLALRLLGDGLRGVLQQIADHGA